MTLSHKTVKHMNIALSLKAITSRQIPDKEKINPGEVQELHTSINVCTKLTSYKITNKRYTDVRYIKKI